MIIHRNDKSSILFVKIKFYFIMFTYVKCNFNSFGEIRKEEVE